MWIRVREGAAFGRPLPYAYNDVDSLGRLYLELLVMPLCVCIHKWRFDGSLRAHPRVRAHPRRMGGGGTARHLVPSFFAPPNPFSSNPPLSCTFVVGCHLVVSLFPL